MGGEQEALAISPKFVPFSCWTWASEWSWKSLHFSLWVMEIIRTNLPRGATGRVKWAAAGCRERGLTGTFYARGVCSPCQHALCKWSDRP